jgi:hypothetical protein
VPVKTLEQMIIFKAESVHVRLSRDAQPYDDSDSNEGNNSRAFRILPDELWAGQAHQSVDNNVVQLDVEWRKRQPDKLEFIAISSTPQTSYDPPTVHTLLIETYGDGTSTRVESVQLNRTGWQAQKPKSRWVFLC